MAITPQNPSINPNPDQKQRSGSGFTNLSRVLSANKDNRLGSAISTGITNNTSQVRSQLGDTRNQFQTAATANDLGSDSNTAARQAALDQIRNGNTTVDPNTVNQFTTFRAGQYAGPTELDATKVNQLQSKTNELAGYGKGLSSGGDKTGVLKAFVAQGPTAYTQGEQKVDSLLLGKTANPAQLAQARQAALNAGGTVDKAQEAARQTGQYLQGKATEFGNTTNQQLGADTTGIQTDVGNKVTSLTTQQQQQIQAAQDALNAKSSFGSPETADVSQARVSNYINTLKSLGVDVGGAQNYQDLAKQTYGLSPDQFAQYVSKNGEINKNTVGSQMDAAKLDALAKLSGTQNDFFDNRDSLGTIDPNKLATLSSDGQSFLTNRKTEGEKALSDALSGYENNAGQTLGQLSSMFDHYGGNQASNAEYNGYVSNLTAAQQAVKDAESKYGQTGRYDDKLIGDTNGQDRVALANSLFGKGYSAYGANDNVGQANLQKYQSYISDITDQIANEQNPARKQMLEASLRAAQGDYSRRPGDGSLI